MPTGPTNSGLAKMAPTLPSKSPSLVVISRLAMLL